MGLNLLWVFLAALGGFVAYFVVGTIGFVALPSMKQEFAKYPAVYRDSAGIMKMMPIGMLSMFVAMLALAVLYALMYHGGSGLAWGFHFGVLIGVFVLCAFVIHNHVNLNIGWALTLQSGIAYFIEWIVACTVIGLIYRP
jgi:hypothetical protein